MPSAVKIRRYGSLEDLTRPWHGLDASWMDDGVCAGATQTVRDKFFADVGSGYTRKEARLAVLDAKAMCLRCPVQIPCLGYAMDADMRGIWGGTTHEERVLIRKREARRRAI